MSLKKELEPALENTGEFLVYETENGRVKLEVRLQNKIGTLTESLCLW